MMPITQLRKKIDTIDRQLIKLLAKRFALAKKIGGLKKKQSRAISDLAREKELALLHASFEKNHTLSAVFTKSLWKLILRESKRLQGQNNP